MKKIFFQTQYFTLNNTSSKVICFLLLNQLVILSKSTKKANETLFMDFHWLTLQLTSLI